VNFRVYVSALLVLVTSLPAIGASISRAQLAEMFGNISSQTKWDLKKPLLWGYFFTNHSREPLETAAKELVSTGYTFIKIYLGDKKQRADPDVWWLHVERVEVHTVESLDQRNQELNALAAKFQVDSYDGMDVGPAE
jgi:hypothetical protein